MKPIYLFVKSGRKVGKLVVTPTHLVVMVTDHKFFVPPLQTEHRFEFTRRTRLRSSLLKHAGKALFKPSTGTFLAEIKLPNKPKFRVASKRRLPDWIWKRGLPEPKKRKRKYKPKYYSLGRTRNQSKNCGRRQCAVLNSY